MKPSPLLFYSATAVFVVLMIILIVIFYVLPGMQQQPLQKQVQAPQIAYKIPLNGQVIRKGTVRENQSLSDLLQSDVSSQMIDRIARETRNVFDVRKIRSGNTWAKIMGKDSVPRLHYFIYEINSIEFVVYDFRDSLKVYKEQKKITRLNRTVQGTITSSLWNCFLEKRLDVNLGLGLSDIFAWTVDFYSLQKGDHFKVIYDELFVDNTPVGIDRIQAAMFSSDGKDFYAFYFDQPGGGDYFDEKGQSLRRSFLKAPLKFSRISSRFTASRMHPILRIARPHFGVDYAAPRGTPVVSLGDGRINEIGWHGGYGRFISVRHNSTYTSTYAHLSGYAKGLKAGSMVKQGEVIGYVGSSGLSTGAHLDFRVYKNGKPTNPLKLESPAAKPVNSLLMEQFKKSAIQLKTRLDSIH